MTTFKDLGLNPMILQALQEIGFEKPTAIQSKTVPHLIGSDKDLIALAQTGTGKTAAFSLPVIHNVDSNNDAVQALILCPTRELAIQVAEDIKLFTKYLRDVTVTPVFGGESVSKQIKELKKGPQIVVGTPGRVNDLINRRVLKVGALKWLVLDEADEMLNMGFKDELDSILETMPESKQVLLFSATMSKPVRRIASNYMNNPEDITVGEKNQGSDNVEHFYYVVHEKDRYQALRRIADANPDIHAIVFCRTRRETQKVADMLIQDHYAAEAIHGDVSQEQRIHVMNRFKDKKVQLLVATDVAARGIDVDKLTHVINYNLPETSEAYVHRSGRTGRAHNEGVSIVIVNMKEKYKIRNLERKIGKDFDQAQVPSGEDICERQLFSLIDNICSTEVNEEQISKYIDLIMKKFENLDRDELIKKMVSVEFNKFLEHYNGSRDLNSSVQKSEQRDAKKASILMARFRINFGRNDGMEVKELFAFLNEDSRLKGVEVGNIDIDDDSTTFEIDQDFKAQILSLFSDAIVGDHEVQIECLEEGIVSSRKPKSGGGKRRSGNSRNRHRSKGGSRRRNKKY